MITNKQMKLIKKAMPTLMKVLKAVRDYKQKHGSDAQIEFDPIARSLGITDELWYSDGMQMAMNVLFDLCDQGNIPPMLVEKVIFNGDDLILKIVGSDETNHQSKHPLPDTKEEPEFMQSAVSFFNRSWNEAMGIAGSPKSFTLDLVNNIFQLHKHEEGFTEAMLLMLRLKFAGVDILTVKELAIDPQTQELEIIYIN